VRAFASASARRPSIVRSAHPFDATDAEERESVFVLEASEFALNSRAATVEAAPLVAVARDARVESSAAFTNRHGELASVGSL
jgi:hypothetical protein